MNWRRIRKRRQRPPGPRRQSALDPTALVSAPATSLVCWHNRSSGRSPYAHVRAPRTAATGRLPSSSGRRGSRRSYGDKAVALVRGASRRAGRSGLPVGCALAPALARLPLSGRSSPARRRGRRHGGCSAPTGSVSSTPSTLPLLCSLSNVSLANPPGSSCLPALQGTTLSRSGESLAIRAWEGTHGLRRDVRRPSRAGAGRVGVEPSELLTSERVMAAGLGLTGGTGGR
jgi:hypothetical protein